MPRPSFDLVTIGESLRDVFYLLEEDATVSCELYKERCVLCLEYAEKVPVKRIVKVHAAGNSANAAVGASRLGLKSALVSWVGDDAAGHDLARHIVNEGVDAKLITYDKKHGTSEATLLTFQGERTQLVHFEPRDYRLPKLPSTRGIYYSAMGEKFTRFDRELAKELNAKPQAFFTFQPGTTHVRAGLKAVQPLLARADLFILNKEEAHHLLMDGHRTTLNLLEDFHRRGAKRVVITDAGNGAEGFDGRDHWSMRTFPCTIKEVTGAGDAFATGMTVALLQDEDFPTALRYGTANSWGVIQEIGPQKGLLDTKRMQATLKKFAKIQPEKIAHR